MHAIDPILIVQMRRRRRPGCADVADDVALLYAGADSRFPREPRQMPVETRNPAAVLESVFCERGRCDAEQVERFVPRQPEETVAQVQKN